MFDIKLAKPLAELSKLKFTESELELITAEMESIVKLMDTVSDFSDTESLVVNESMELKNVRADEVHSSMPREDALKNAAKKTDTCFTVPKVV